MNGSKSDKIFKLATNTLNFYNFSKIIYLFISQFLTVFLYRA